jgi:hypothetical protein
VNPRFSLHRVSPFVVASLVLAMGSVSSRAEVAVSEDGDVVHVKIDGKPFTDFYSKGGNAMKPFMYPLRSATGKILTRQFPMETNVDGEPTDHPHHRGLWFAYENINGVDYWNNEADYKSTNRGHMEVKKISDVHSGADAGGFKADIDWIDTNGKTVLSEARTTAFHETSTSRIIDVNLVLTAKDEIKWGDAKDGAFGLRLTPALCEPGGSKKGGASKIPGTGKMTNAEGASGEKEAWGKPSHWIDYAGEIDGEKIGVAVFDHPGNSRPARWHSRGYGLLAANPFGLKSFTNDKSQDGSFTMKAGDTMHFQYRVIIHPGDTASANIPALWEEYLKEVK